MRERGREGVSKVWEYKNTGIKSSLKPTPSVQIIYTSTHDD